MNKLSLAKQSTISPLQSWLILCFLSLIWGSSYILMKKGLVVYSSTQLAVLRLSISALAFLPIFLFHLKRIDWSKWHYLFIVGLTGSGLPSFLFAIAQTEISSSLAGILNSLTPLFTLIQGALFFKVALFRNKVLGVFTGLLGASLLILLGNQVGLKGNTWYGLLVLLATICYATSSNTVAAKLRNMSSLLISTVSFVMVGIPAIIYLAFSDFPEILQTKPGAVTALGYITILALGSTVLASVIFFRLVKWTDAVFASMVSYIVPIVALFWGILDGESITILHLIGMMLILAGVYLSRKK